MIKNTHFADGVILGFDGLQKMYEAIAKWLSRKTRETKTTKEASKREEGKERQIIKKSTKKQFPPTTIPTLISILMLFAGIPKFFPYGYYTLLRFVVCGTGGYIAYFAFEEEKRFIGFLSILVALLFNPIIPIHLAKDAWVVIDFITTIFFTITIFTLRVEK